MKTNQSALDRKIAVDDANRKVRNGYNAAVYKARRILDDVMPDAAQTNDQVTDNLENVRAAIAALQAALQTAERLVK